MEEIKTQGIIVEQTMHHVEMKINKMEAEYKKTVTGYNRLGRGLLMRMAI